MLTLTCSLCAAVLFLTGAPILGAVLAVLAGVTQIVTSDSDE